jgi:hypothetical protein
LRTGQVQLSEPMAVGKKRSNTISPSGPQSGQTMGQAAHSISKLPVTETVKAAD